MRVWNAFRGTSTGAEEVGLKALLTADLNLKFPSFEGRPLDEGDIDPRAICSAIRRGVGLFVGVIS